MSVIIIDPATGGIAGLYLDAYHTAMPDGSVTTVGAYSSMSAATRKFFYPYSDLSGGGRQRLGRLRLPVRYLEMILGLMRCLLLILRRRPNAVFYALSSNLAPELVFIFLLRLIRVPVFVVCHDVVPFIAAHEHRSFKDWQRRQFYRVADRLICHNRRSITELIENYGQPAEKLDYLPFPIMDIRPLVAQSMQDGAGNPRTRFLFIGHVRPEKGVNTLVRAWRRAQVVGIDAELVIAGQVPRGVVIADVKTTHGLTLDNHYIDEADYVRYIADADAVILPYIQGTNSGVLSNAVSLSKPVIVSDIPMFVESGLVPTDAYFPVGDEAVLAQKMVSFSKDGGLRRDHRVQSIAALRDPRINEFAITLKNLLDKIGKSR